MAIGSESRNERLAELIEQHGIYALASGDVRDILAALRVAPSEKGSKCAFYKCQNGTMTDHPYCADHAIPQPATRSNDKRQLLEKIQKALTHVHDLCQGKERWTMRVPADPSRDSDLVIADALEAARSFVCSPVAPSHGGSNGCSCRFDDGVLIEVCEEHKAWKADAPPYTPSSTASNAEAAIREHNEGCDAACAAQRPNERQSGGCGYQKHDGSLVYSRRCPECPQDWKIDFPITSSATGAYRQVGMTYRPVDGKSGPVIWWESMDTLPDHTPVFIPAESRVTQEKP